MPRATFMILLALAASIGGCAGTEAFTCADDEACAGVGPGARCEANGWCSYEDETCDGGRRYGDLAGDGLGGVCLGEEGGTHGTTTGSPMTSPTTEDPPSDDTSTDTDGLDTATSEDTGPPVSEGWWDCGWAERRELTLDVPDTGEVLAGFPVLVILDASRIDASIMAADGRDLRFVAEDGTTVLPHQLEQWSPAGLSWAWVRMSELPPGETRLTMYYGNPAATPTDGTAVWGGYTGVWHMGFEFADATGISAPGLGTAVTDWGQAGPAQRFVPPLDGIAVTPSPPLDGLFAQGGTITAMIRASGWGSNEQGLVVGRADGPNGDGGWVLAVDGSGEALRFARGFTINRRTWYTPDGSLSLHAWRHVAVVYQDDALADPVFYVDGVPQRAIPQGMSNGDPEPDDAPTLHLGGEPSSGEQTFDGIVDEVRVAPLPRSGAWMTVEVAALRDELASYGAPQSSPCE
jgi:hypothetical protein